MTSPDTKLIACPFIKIPAAKQGPAGVTGRAARRGGPFAPQGSRPSHALSCTPTTKQIACPSEHAATVQLHSKLYQR